MFKTQPLDVIWCKMILNSIQLNGLCSVFTHLLSSGRKNFKMGEHLQYLQSYSDSDFGDSIMSPCLSF